MRVPGINVEFELEVLSGRLHKSLFIDGKTTDSIDAGDGHRLLLDLDSQSVLVVTKRGVKMLIPTASFAGLILEKAPCGTPAPAVPPPSVTVPVTHDVTPELELAARSMVEPQVADDGAPPPPPEKPKSRKPTLKRKR